MAQSRACFYGGKVESVRGSRSATEKIVGRWLVTVEHGTHEGLAIMAEFVRMLVQRLLTSEQLLRKKWAGKKSARRRRSAAG